MKKFLLMPCMLIMLWPAFSNAQNTDFLDDLKQTNAEIWILDSVHTYIITPGTMDSVNMVRILYDVDGVGNRVSIITYMFNIIDQVWNKQGKIEYTYDEWDNPTMTMSYLWNAITETWDNSRRNMKEFIPGDSLIKNEVESEWDASATQWNNLDSVAYLRDAQNHIDTIYKYNWDDGSNTFAPFSIKRRVIDAGGLVQSDTIYYHDGIWFASHNGNYTYNAAGNFLEYHRMYRASTGAAWENELMILKAYDVNERLVSRERWSWYPTSTEWVIETKQLSHYDENSHLIFLRGYRWDIDMWEPDFSSVFFWSQHTVYAIPDHDLTAEMQVFPNPANTMISVVVAEEGELNISSVDGRQVSSIHLSSGSNSIDISGYPAGIYILKLDAPYAPAPFKLLIRK